MFVDLEISRSGAPSLTHFWLLMIKTEWIRTILKQREVLATLLETIVCIITNKNFLENTGILLFPFRWKSRFCWIVQSKTVATTPIDSVKRCSERRWPFLRVIQLPYVVLYYTEQKQLSFTIHLSDCFDTNRSRKINTKVSKFSISAEDESEPISDLEIVEER